MVLREERPRAGVLRLTLVNPPANALSEAVLAALQCGDRCRGGR